MVQSSPHYPKPKEMGGHLIRRVIGNLKEAGLKLPIQNRVGIGFSGGADSLALAHLICRYGRRIASKDNLTLLHVNHQWRGAASDQDQERVEEWAQEWGVDCRVIRAAPPEKSKSSRNDSWENDARKKRLAFFESWAQGGARVFTAHQANDLFETYLWRLLEGTIFRQPEGIRREFGVQIRPFLNVTRSEIEVYLREENLKPLIDSTNSDPRFFRAYLRQNLLPKILKIRPQTLARTIDMHRRSAHFKKQHFEKNDLLLKHGETERLDVMQIVSNIISDSERAHGFRVSRGHFEMIGQVERTGGPMNLPGGWTLRFENSLSENRTRWVLEKAEGP